MAILVPIGLEYYERIVEERVIQTPVSTTPVVRPQLTAQEQDEVDDLVRLAEMQMAQIGTASTVDEITYVLSFGPNNVAQLVATVLDIDPGDEIALELRQRAFDIYIDRARQLESEADYGQAMALARRAHEIIPGSGTVRRLQRRICDSEPAACGSL